jgi:hypothetical protein
MEGIAVIVSRQYAMRDIVARLERAFPSCVVADRQKLVVESAGERVYVCTEAASDDDRDAAARVSIGDPHAIVVDYHDPGLCTQVISVLVEGAAAIVDTGFGDVLTGAEFLERVEREPSWDWRRTASV